MRSTRAGQRVPQQARALGDPTRYAVFERLRAAARALTVAEIGEAFPLHPNAIRLHLARLREAGLVVEEASAGTGRGRPALRYRLSPGAIERWDDSGPHEELALMLLELVLSRRSPRDVGAETGARLGSTLSGGVTSPPDGAGAGTGAGTVTGSPSGTVDALVGVARRLGFDPELAAGPSAGSLPEIVLRHCPFASGAQRAPQVVCELHHGLAEGVCRGAGSAVRVTALHVRDPYEAGCRILLAPTA